MAFGEINFQIATIKFLIMRIINERLTDIYATSTSRPLIAHQPIAYLTIASLMLSTIYFTSSSVT